jgi:5-methylcytosine-specific restriction endonuclease McrA
MLSISSAKEQQVLRRLIAYIDAKTITPNNAWSCLSQPNKKKTFGTKAPTEILFSEEEVASLTALKGRVKARLEESSRRSCSYCKRPVGKHGYGWHIEHVRCKSKKHEDTFNLANLVLACVDCNMIKYQKVDSQATPYDIIDPSMPGFTYGTHLRFTLLATEDICLLSYRPVSPEGRRTYTKLKFDTLERMELIKSLSPAGRNRIQSLDDAAAKFLELASDHPVAFFLAELKRKLSAV